MIQMEKILARIEEFRPLSPSMGRILAMLAHGSPSFSDLEDVIVHDPGCTAEVLRMANTASNAPRTPITSVRLACTRLGTDAVLRHLVAKALQPQLRVSLKTYGYDENTLWRHSVAVAIASEETDIALRTRQPHMAFTAGILHDLGMVIIAQAAGDELSRLVRDKTTGTTMTLADAEEEGMGISHAMVGAALASKWGLHTDICEAIRLHHSPATGPLALADLVRMGDVIANTIGEGLGDSGTVTSYDQDLHFRLDMGRRQFELLCANVQYRFTQVLQAYG